MLRYVSGFVFVLVLGLILGCSGSGSGGGNAPIEVPLTEEDLNPNSGRASLEDMMAQMEAKQAEEAKKAEAAKKTEPKSDAPAAKPAETPKSEVKPADAGKTNAAEPAKDAPSGGASNSRGMGTLEDIMEQLAQKNNSAPQQEQAPAASQAKSPAIDRPAGGGGGDNRGMGTLEDIMENLARQAQDNPASQPAAQPAASTAPQPGPGGKMSRLNAGLANGLPTGNSGNAENTGARPSFEELGAFGGANPANNANAAPAGPKSFIELANENFKSHQEQKAVQMLYAHWLTDKNSIEEYPVRWVPGLREPRILVRWGVGIELTKPSDYNEQPPVIGDKVSSNNSSPLRGQRSFDDNMLGGGNAANRMYASANRSEPYGAILYYTGDFGARLIKRLDSRRTYTTPFYGKILASINSQTVPGGSSGATPPQAGRGNAMLEEAVPTASGGGKLGGLGAAAAGTASSNNSGLGTIIPGVTFIGVEESRTAEKSMIARAKSLGLDGLVIISVDVKTRRSKPAYSSTSATLYNLKTGESRRTSAQNNETVAERREKTGEEDDPVEKELDKIFQEFSDSQFQVEDMPKLTNEIVKQRVDSLVAEAAPNPLPVVIEIVNYFKGGLLDESSTQNAVATLLDPETAKKLISGTPEDKRGALEKWMQSHGASNADESDGFR